MRFEVLGPLRVGSASAAAAVSARRQQALLAMLLLHAGRVVPAERLVDAVWADRLPQNAASQLQSAVYRLRRQLAAAGAADAIATEPGGYRLRTEPDNVDLWQFRRLRDAARAAGDHEAAAARYREALQLWRGPALAGIDSTVVRRAAAALDEERLQAQQEYIEVELALGRAGGLIPELTELVEEHPYREELHAALMRALYQAGRQADALAAYRRLRQVLHDDLGTEPGGELHRLHQHILNRDPELAAPAPAADPTVPPRELPAEVAGFTGRDAALKALDGMLGQPAGPVVITAIVGTAGIGKTALAVRWAHQVAHQFPDGQLYLNLRGYAAAAPVRSIDALAALLRSLGVPPEQIPADETQAAVRYRTRLAGRRVLVILDNAATAGQVRPLLPGAPGCFVLITSRDRLAGLVARDGAHRLPLGVLTPDEARALLIRLLDAERVAAEPDAAAELARACAYLPLAIRIAAAMLLDGPERSIRDYLADLTAGDRLAMLQADGDEDSAVRAAFELSYRRLPAAARQLFRLLGLVPGADFTAPAAGALTGTRPDEAGPLLATLASAHLVEQHQPGRYTFHDLLRLYARERSEQDDDGSARRDAMHRFLHWYLGGTAAASELLYPDVLRLPIGPPDPPRLPFADATGALAWLEAERTNLVAAVRHAADHGPRRLAWLLADRLRSYFWIQRYPADGLQVGTAARAAAEQDGDQQAQAAMNLGLGTVHQSAGRYAEAIGCFSAAAEHAAQAGWEDLEAGALANLGGVQILSGQIQDAGDRLTRALALYRRTGQRYREAVVLGTLGHLYRQQGRLQQSAECCAEQVAIHRGRDPGDRESLARSLANLGAAELDLGRLADAGEHLAAALQLHQEVGGRYGEAHALESLAATRLAAGRVAEARDLAQAAMVLASEIGDPRAEVEATTTLGSVACQLASLWPAVAHHRRALAAARRTRCPDLEVLALIGLATAHLRLDRHDEAARYGRRALESARAVGYRVFEGRALVALAEIRLAQGRYEEAGGHAMAALDSHRETGHRLGEARALTVLGSVRHRAGDPRARRHWEAARDLYAEIGAPVPEDLAVVANPPG